MSSNLFHVIEHVLPGQHIREYPRGTSVKQEDTFRLAVKQYIPVDNPNPQPGDVTIIGAHGNGFPKVFSRFYITPPFQLMPLIILEDTEC
jgi:hypothetical protein